ncbi:JAB1/Mov34/MPN/PAD-1 ubiquitin protease-domain-containing protein [Phlyctochytrium arcticum]|nr:JAB1/Mov34/MPN/PAD-1 ubiquitin protease-domain-containing protein [Phlyctochytrium arcticum]
MTASESALKTESADFIYGYDADQQKAAVNARPWTKDPQYFKKVKISAVALIKMVMHARSGGDIEIMGLMQGKIVGDTMIIMDAFALPVEGTETRVNAQAEGYEYMVDYMEKIKEVGRLENAIGWYHSHPGYGCWLSGIDVSTQMLNQQYQEPFVAVVIDPNRTISAGKVEIGAFRTYPQGYKALDDSPSEYQTIPLNKIEDFGVHAKQYYSLEISYFKSKFDSELLERLWHKYWINTLSSSPLLTNREYTARQILDLADKIEKAEASVSQGARSIGDRRKGEDGAVSTMDPKKHGRHCSDSFSHSARITSEAVHGVMSQVLKDVLFNHSTGCSHSH